MDSLDLEVLRTCARWIEQSVACELITVTRTWGSSPRPIGSMLAINADGHIVGSISGGCIEDDLIASARTTGISRKLPQVLRYGISADEAHRFGLPCGGTIEVVIQPLTAASRIAETLAHLARHEMVSRSVDLATGEVSLAVAEPGQTTSLDVRQLITTHGPQWRLLIIGAGPLSSYVAQIALTLDYQVAVCDPREEYQAGWHLDGVEVVHAMPDDWILSMRMDNRTAVLALTHDPKLDDLALMEALKSKAFYVGAIGSRINHQRRRERLVQFDITNEQVAALHGPVGLLIGSKTPAEIAVSILAEITAVKNGIPSSQRVSHGALM